METDRELLRRYGQDGDEAAFTEVVRRHTDLVYSAALRLVAGDTHLARDVAQKVFCTLACKAASLGQRDNLLGWLHTTTRYAASVAVRSERRRRHHEQEAAMNAHDDPAPATLDWTQLRPLLDEAVGSLRVEDREAVLLRFFQGKSHREVGVELGLNEALARKRVERALEKLRLLLTRRGVTASTALLATTLAAHSVQAAPEGLAAGLGTISLATAAEVGSIGFFWPTMMLFMKTKTTVITSILILGVALVGTWLWKNQSITDPSEKSATGARPLKVAPASVEPARIAAAPASAVGSDQSESTAPAPRVGFGKAAPAPRAPASATGSVAVSADTRANLSSAMQNIIQLVNTGDYDTLVRNYLPQKGGQQNTDPAAYDERVQLQAHDPAAQQMFQQLGQQLAQVQNATPVFSDDGRSARLKVTPDAPMAIVFVQMDGTWRFAGTESTLPPPSKDPAAVLAPQPVKHATGTGGGYVP